MKGLRLLLVATLVLASAGCTLIAGGGEATDASASPEASTDPTASAAPTETATPEPPPPTGPYQYAQANAPDLCAFLLDLPELHARYDRVERLPIPEHPLECAIDLSAGENHDMLDVKIQLAEPNLTNNNAYVWRGVDAAMGTLIGLEGLGASAYYFDAALGRTVVIRDVNMILRILLLPNVNTGGAPIVDAHQQLITAAARHLMNTLRVPL